MAVDERRRSELFQGLAGVIGTEQAATMFELMPPTGSEVATSSDVARLEQRFDEAMRRFDERLDERLDSQRNELIAVFRGELNEVVSKQLRAMVVSAVSTALAVTGSALALAQVL